MDDSLVAGGVPEQEARLGPVRDFVPMKVGGAIVFVEAVGEADIAPSGDGLYTVAPLSPQEAFSAASDFLHECVRVVGERIEGISEHGPSEVSVEFSLTFQVKGKVAIIPVFVTAETGAQSGLKVKATWKIHERRATERQAGGG